jgi:very-short-patch-repair endonuclease
MSKGLVMNESWPQKPRTDPGHLDFARALRRERTDAEARLWSRLRGRRLNGFKFRRQQPVGPYTLDFYCHDRQLVVELDGGQHSSPENVLHDEARTEYLASHGLAVVRFWNHHVLTETDAVCRTILRALEEPGTIEGRMI